MDRTAGIEVLIESLHALPYGHVVTWCDGGSAFDDYLLASVDVSVPEIEQRTGCNWSWNIVPWEGHRKSTGDATTLVVVPEVGVILRGGRWVTVTLDAELARGLHSHEVGWEPSTLSAALSEWCAVLAGREDLRFAYRPGFIHPVATGAQQRVGQATPEG